MGAASQFGAAELYAAQQEGLWLRSYRFWRPPDLTLVEAFGVIALDLLAFTSQDGRERAAYQVALEVRDSTGIVLLKREWRNAVEIPALAEASRQRATTAEYVQFQLKPGRYRMQMEVRDSASGRGWTAAAEIVASSTPMAGSDLVVAGVVEQVAEGEEPPAAAIRRGELAVTPNFTGALTPEHADVSLFAEVYRASPSPDTANVRVIVAGVGRPFRQALPPLRRIFPVGGGAETLRAKLTGLPLGEYQLTFEAAFPTDTVRLSHRIEMLPAGAGQVALRIATPYQGLSEAALDSLFSPMRYLATPNEQRTYWSLPDGEAKRRFLVQFWEARAAELGADPDSLRLEFAERVEYADRQLRPSRPGQRGVAGWQTDRGRIHVTYGAPAERYVESQRQAQRNPWEVWKYTTGRGDKYVFWDRTGLGDFQLVFSTNREEPGIPDWQRLFTPEALRFITQF